MQYRVTCEKYLQGRPKPHVNWEPSIKLLHLKHAFQRRLDLLEAKVKRSSCSGKFQIEKLVVSQYLELHELIGTANFPFFTSESFAKFIL